ncbi:MAG: leucine-rich repeat protein [Treponema sp.]|nr:leucine-rich repeat protein [Treponema sp.]
MKKLNRFAALAAIILLLVMGCKVEPDAIAVESVLLSETTLTIEPGKTRRLTATITPNNADDKTVKWSSSDKTVALVDSNGMIAAVKEGTAIITAQAGDKMAMCIVTVKSTVAVESIRLSETTLTLTPYTTMKLTATVTPYNADDTTVTWSSSDDDIATVDNYGTVRAYAEGTATITAQAGDKTATCTVTVKSSLTAVENVSLNTTTLTIEPGATMMLTATVTPSNADDKTVKWSSSNNVIAMVDNNGTVSAHAEGTATITAQAGDKTATCTVTVHFHSYSEGKCTKCGAVQDFNGTIDENGVLTNYWGNEATVVIPDGVTSIGDYAFEYCCTSLASVTIPTSVTSIGSRAFEHCTSLAEIKFEGTKAQWKAIEGSDNVAVACVRCSDGNIDNPKYLVTSVSLNTTTLTIEPDVTMMLTATVTPSNADATVTWSSSDNAIAMVDNNGTVRAHTVGTATITAQAGDKTATCTVTVHFHSYSGGKCTVCGAVQYFNGMINDNGVLMYYYGNEATVVIPDSVTSIGYGAFYNCTSLTSVTIPDSVTSISDNAFYNCNGLTSVTYTGTLAGWCAIDFLNYDANPLANKKAILYISNLPVKDVKIPSDVREIKNYAFMGCTSLTNVTIPDSVTSIGDYAFYNCTSLMSVTIPNGVTSIGSNAFAYTSLTNVTIPDSVTSIENAVFYNCTRLTSVTIPDNVTSIGHSAFTDCTGLTSVTIGNGVTSIEHYAFRNCTSLTSVTIGNNVTSIGERVFSDCTSLESVIISTSVKSIGYNAFSGCTSLAEIQFEGTKAQWKAIKGSDNVTVACVRCSDDNIGNQENPILVNNITLDKNTLTLIRNGTAKLTATVTPSNADNKTVTWSSSNTSIATVDNDGMVTAISAGIATITAKAGDKTATCTVTVNPIPVNKVTLDKDTLTLTRDKTAKLTATVYPDNADDKTVTWSSSDETVATVDNNGTVTAVKEGTANITARAGGKTATCKVTVPVNNVKLDTYTLTLKRNKTAKLTATVYPDNADNKTVTWSSSNISVATVDNDGTVTAVGAGYATITARVGDKTAQCTVHVHSYSGGKCTLCGDVPQLTGGTIDENGVLTKYKYENNSLLIFDLNIDIPEGVTGIGDRAFEQATSNLKSVTIPDSVTYIGNAAFQDCRYIKSVTIPSSVTSIGYNAFLWCESLTSVIYTGTLADWCAIDFSNGSANPLSNKNVILYIKASQVTDVNIPNNVTEINYAFYGYTSLTNVTIPTSVTSIGDHAFYNCTSLTNVTIPDSVTSIGDSAFSNCTSLTSVTIPDSVTSIGKYAFSNCTSLMSVTILNGVTTIREATFLGCTGLTSVRIPNSVKYFINNSIFLGCTALKDVYYDGTQAEWNNIKNINDIFPDDVIIHSTDNAWKYKE